MKWQLVAEVATAIIACLVFFGGLAWLIVFLDLPGFQ